MSAYLFAHFIGEHDNGEQVFFSISKDGLHWNDLNQGTPVLYSTIGECGVRDPFLIKHPTTKQYYLIATDLKMETKKDWSAAVECGSKDLIVWESNDLVQWSEPRACTVGVEDAGCVWAPEAIYDEKEDAFLVFFASYVEGKHRIYQTYTTDFIAFSDTRQYIEDEMSIIDTTMIHTNGNYYRFTKDERSGMILQSVGNDLAGEFTPIHNETLSTLAGLEGPECYQLPDGSWCLICDQFKEGKGYLPMIFDDLATGKMRVLSQEDYDLGVMKKRHGGVIEISIEEYERLENQ